jgi:hypothetical protein
LPPARGIGAPTPGPGAAGLFPLASAGGGVWEAALPYTLARDAPLHHHRASRLLDETLTETETTTTVAVRATTWSFQRSRSQKDGSPDPSLVTPLAVVISTTLSTACCIGPSTDTLGLSSIVVWSNSIVAGYTRASGRLLAWCADQTMISRV